MPFLSLLPGEMKGFLIMAILIFEYMEKVREKEYEFLCANVYTVSYNKNELSVHFQHFLFQSPVPTPGCPMWKDSD